MTRWGQWESLGSCALRDEVRPSLPRDRTDPRTSDDRG